MTEWLVGYLFIGVCIMCFIHTKEKLDLSEIVFIVTGWLPVVIAGCVFYFFGDMKDEDTEG